MAEELCKHTNFRKTARICEMRQIVAKKQNAFLSKCYHCEDIEKMKKPEKNLSTNFLKKDGKCVDCGNLTRVFVNSDLCPRCAAIKGVKSPKRNSLQITLDFKEHTMLLQTLKEDAMENFRELKPHVLFILTQYCKKIKSENKGG